MGKLMKVNVVVVPFPFSDLTSSIRRPALIIANLKGDDLILCQITSKEHSSDPYQIPLESSDFSKGGLKIKSFIKPSIVFTLRKSIIIRSVGEISKKKISEVENMLCKIIKE